MRTIGIASAVAFTIGVFVGCKPMVFGGLALWVASLVAMA